MSLRSRGSGGFSFAVCILGSTAAACGAGERNAASPASPAETTTPSTGASTRGAGADGATAVGKLSEVPPAPPFVPPVVALPAGAPGPGEWATWPFAKKKAYMETGFLQAERVIFGSFEPVRYRQLDCHTCHGAGARDGSYKMPNPDLPRLAGGKDGFVELAQHEGPQLAFMQKTVAPETAHLLGVPEFDFAAHTGFSCFHCHLRTTEKEP